PDATETTTTPLHDALPILGISSTKTTAPPGSTSTIVISVGPPSGSEVASSGRIGSDASPAPSAGLSGCVESLGSLILSPSSISHDRKSTRLNSSHDKTSYA